jgi:hypothetical protein
MAHRLGHDEKSANGLSQVPGSGGYRHRRVQIVGLSEFLSKARTERTIIDSRKLAVPSVIAVPTLNLAR